MAGKLPGDVLIPVFTCANRNCACLKKAPGLYFFTNSFLKVEEHSRENDSPMWIAQIPFKEYISMCKTNEKLIEMTNNEPILEEEGDGPRRG